MTGRAAGSHAAFAVEDCVYSLIEHLLQRGTLYMDDVRPFDNLRIHDLLRRNELAYTTSAEGTCFVQFGGMDDAERPLVVLLPLVAGPIFTIRAFSPVSYPIDAVAVLLATINNWHAKHCWPRGHVAFDDPQVPDESAVRVYADSHVNLAPGVHDQLLDQLFWSTVEGAQQLLAALDAALPSTYEHAVLAATPTAEELDGWLALE